MNSFDAMTDLENPPLMVAPSKPRREGWDCMCPVKILLAAVVLLPGTVFFQAVAAVPPKPMTFAQYLKESAVSKEVIARFLEGPSWARFDPELGHVLGNYLML
jgi:hypothetical protein